MSLNTGMSELACWCNSSNDSPNIAQTSHWKLCLRQIDMEGYIHDSWRSFEHKFGIEMISFINHQSHPHINLTPFDSMNPFWLSEFCLLLLCSFMHLLE